MYEYSPKLSKKRELFCLFILLLSASILIAFSMLPQVIFPSLLQLLAVCLLVGAVLVIGKYLMCRYAYRVDRREGGSDADPLDFTVIEYYGSRVRVVCRVSLADIEEIVAITPENRRELGRMTRGKSCYRYTAALQAENPYLLKAHDADRVFWVEILADERLLQALHMI